MTARLLPTAALLLAVAALFAQNDAVAQNDAAPEAAPESKSPEVAAGYASPRVDFGIVVVDLERSKRFYEQVLGFKQAKTLDVPGDVLGGIGLTDGLPLHVAVMQLGSGPDATQLKLMQVHGSRPTRPDATFIHSAYGVRYLTLYVTDLDAALKHAAEKGAKPLADGAVDLPESVAAGVGLACLRDPDGNIIELVGPRAK